MEATMATAPATSPEAAEAQRKAGRAKAERDRRARIKAGKDQQEAAAAAAARAKPTAGEVAATGPNERFAAIADRANALVPDLKQKAGGPSARRLVEMIGKTDPLVYAGFPADADPAKSLKELVAWSRGKLAANHPTSVTLRGRVREIRDAGGMPHALWGHKIGALLAAIAESAKES